MCLKTTATNDAIELNVKSFVDKINSSGFTQDQKNNIIRSIIPPKALWEMMYVNTWNDIAEFERREVKSWKNASPVQQEARAAERMKAYVTLTNYCR